MHVMHNVMHYVMHYVVHYVMHYVRAGEEHRVLLDEGDRPTQRPQADLE